MPSNATYTESNTNPLPTACVAFLPLVTETYFIEVSSATGKFGPNTFYVIEKE